MNRRGRRFRSTESEEDTGKETPRGVRGETEGIGRRTVESGVT